MVTDYQESPEGTYSFVPGEYASIDVIGPDAALFLHNLCTQDINGLPVGESREAFLTTNKARVVAHVMITRREPEVFHVGTIANFLPDSPQKIADHLHHFLISERAEIVNHSSDRGLLRLIGPKAKEFAKKAARPPLCRHRLFQLEGVDFLWQADGPDLSELSKSLDDAGAISAGPLGYKILRIEAGLPEYGIDIEEDRLAMEVNRPQAISYTKGCYLGQETIVMARDRGQVNRMMLGVIFSRDNGVDRLHAKGTKLFRGKDEVGQVTSSVFSPRLQTVIGLAYLRRGSWDAGTELALTPDGATGAVVSALPFLPAP